MSASTEEPGSPGMALQPLTSDDEAFPSSVHSDGVAAHREVEEEEEEEGKLMAQPDGEPTGNMNGHIGQPGRRPEMRKYLETMVLYFGFMILGLSIGIQGPSILDLQLAVHTDTGTITRIFIGRALGSLCGALLSGLILQKFDCYVLYGLANFRMTTLAALTPWTWHVIIMAVTMVLASLARGFCDAAGNMCLLIVWDTDNGPWMQTLHLVFAIGALIGPLLVKPFLKEFPRYVENGDVTNVTVAAARETTTPNITVAPCSAKDCALQYPNLGTDIWIPFLLLGVLGVIVTCSFFGLYFTNSPQWSNKRKKEDTDLGPHTPRNKVLEGLVILFVYLFYTCSCATEIGFQSYIFAFAVDYHGWHKSDAAVLTSLTYATFMVGRVGGIFTIRCFRPTHVLLFDSIGLVVSNITLAFSSHIHGAVIWVSCALNGWFVSRLFATGVTWMDRYVRISGIVASVFMVAGSTGDMLGPIVLGALYGIYGLGAFGPLILASSSAMLLMCIAMLFVAHKLGPRELSPSNAIPAEIDNVANDL